MPVPAKLIDLLDTDQVPDPESVSIDTGYVDLLPQSELRDATARHQSLSQRTMEFPLLAPIYEHLWRPAGVLAFMGFNVKHFRTERDKTVRALGLQPGSTVIDVACGPGNFTSRFAEAVSPDGVAVGVDVSVPMLRRAVRTNRHPNAVYVRADGTQLPFGDGVFDAASCYAALYLIPEPFRVVDELIRLVRPGGRISIMTSRASRYPVIKAGQKRILGATGLRMFELTDFTDYFQAQGLTDISREVYGVVQYVHATKPSN
ncbi:methyltransferase domain-containing protein [Hoyosella rhizosphaerae]|uniref:Similarity with UbiE/COQ5 methyltransferase n=1 Tax=Hoyosella rhizosphaerae TaxID=1755582 RepID=A0A916XJP8_9ACTN|nr:methyltransferase domain-containing protein [Hoyosella rhizosphaerae]MBN4925409.1 methyltransferase domain-containing protein [Hoyosella rhizosphaerae]GGC75415.1 similarity with UbiE/COQ5 methyltransferase [Hoyosella rhizosphaerae]